MGKHLTRKFNEEEETSIAYIWKSFFKKLEVKEGGQAECVSECSDKKDLSTLIG